MSFYQMNIQFKHFQKFWWILTVYRSVSITRLHDLPFQQDFFLEIGYEMFE